MVLYKKMDRIIFFDIDKTLFDREGYLQSFFGLLTSDYNLSESEVDEVGRLYDVVKDEYGYFTFEAFLAKIYERFPALSEKLDFYFKPENLDRFLFEDSKVLFQIKNARLGIFSKGDIALQKIKINKFKGVLEEDLIYIFHNKLEKVGEILEKHKDSEIILVDDNVAIMIAAKDINKSVTTVLIDRNDSLSKVNGIDFKIPSLFSLKEILSE